MADATGQRALDVRVGVGVMGWVVVNRAALLNALVACRPAGMSEEHALALQSQDLRAGDWWVWSVPSAAAWRCCQAPPLPRFSTDLEAVWTAVRGLERRWPGRGAQFAANLALVTGAGPDVGVLLLRLGPADVCRALLATAGTLNVEDVVPS